MRHTAPLHSAASQAGPAAAWESSYPGTPDQPGRVRAWLRSLLGGCPVADDVILLISELAANAVAHSNSGKPGGTFTVRLTHVPGAHVRAEVCDQGSGWDGDLGVSARQPHGLYLLRALATRCGITPGGRSCTAWFSIDDPPHPVAAATPAPTRPAADGRLRSSLPLVPQSAVLPGRSSMDTPQSPHPPAQRPPLPGQFSQHLTAIAARLGACGIPSRLTRLAGTPVLTIEDPAAGPSPATVTIDPDTRDGPGLPLECTCLWTPAPGTAPETTADTIITVLNAVRSAADRPQPGDGLPPQC